MKVYHLFCLLLLYVSGNAQEGGLQFSTRHFLDNKELMHAEVKVMSGNSVIAQSETGKSNRFKTVLPFGKVYDVYFKQASCQTVFIRVFADIPAEKHGLRTAYELDLPFFPRDPGTFDTSQFHNPIHRIVFDGKSRFVDDTAYMNAFLKKVLRPQTDDSSGFVLKKTAPVKQYVQLVGRLSLDNDKQTLLKNKTVYLLNKDGKKLLSTQTSNHGIFVFQGVDSDIANGLQVEVSTADNPNRQALKLKNLQDETVEMVQPEASGACVYQATEKNQLVKKLSDKDYRYNIGGKLIVRVTGSQIASGKEVGLLNNRNEQVQKVKTDVFGNFLFTKIVPGQTYSFVFETSVYEAAPELYTTKDKFIRRVDSLGGKHYVYRFTASSGSRFNDLLLDDSELRMNVKGRLYGENKNNPLADFKVILLNDRYKTIDSAMTDKDGDFVFSYMPYNRNLMFNADNERNILEVFNNILVFDNSENLIKIVSTVKGSRFNYQPLLTEQSRLTEVFVDDPWLQVLNVKDAKGHAMPVINENILFEFDKADLLPQSKQTLDKIILAMKMNKNFSIDLGAHSDSKGSAAYNLKLSDQRAEAAMAYMISKGIEPARISAKGYGESKLLNNCSDAVLCSDDEHAVNRRLEFKLIFN